MQKQRARKSGFGPSADWWRGQDLNLRPSGYEPDELPGCSTPRRSRSTTVASDSAGTQPATSTNLADTMGRRKREREQMAASLAALTAEIESLRQQLAQQVSDVASATGTTSALLARVSSIETSVSNLGSELSRQLHELGSDIENLSRSSDDDMSATIEQIRASQVRLASEQARYEIAFRQDLAGLAEEIRRQSRG